MRDYEYSYTFIQHGKELDRHGHGDNLAETETILKIPANASLKELLGHLTCFLRASGYSLDYLEAKHDVKFDKSVSGS